MAQVNQTYSQQPMYQPRNSSFLDKMKTSEKIWGLIAILMFIGTINDGFPVFFPVIILFVIFYRVSHRERTKDRLSNLLLQSTETTIGYLSHQLDEKQDHIVEVLKIMILDEGYPIRLDLVNMTVKKIGKFYNEAYSAGGSYGPRTSSDVSTETEVNVANNEPEVARTTDDHSEGEEIHKTSQVETESFTEKTVQTANPMSSCASCSGKLPISAKYCSNCGVKQFD